MDNDDELVQRVFAACGRLGIPASTEKGGGGSDANVMALHGIKPVVLSTGMTKVHTTEETLKVEELNKCAALVLGPADQLKQCRRKKKDRGFENWNENWNENWI